MPRRSPQRATTHEAVQVALDTVIRLLEGGPDRVTVEAVAKHLDGRGAAWVYAYLGGKEALIEAATRREVAQQCSDLADITARKLPTRRRIRVVIDVLLPDARGRSSLWLLAQATRMGLGQRGPLAEAISRALGPEMGAYSMALGGGILGVLESAVSEAWRPDREELLRTILDMTMAVALFQRAFSERRGGLN